MCDSICVCVYVCVGMCLCVWTSAPACALCASIHGYTHAHTCVCVPCFVCVQNTHIPCFEHTHTHTHCLAQTKHRETHKHTLPRGSAVFDPAVSVFVKVTVDFSPLTTPPQCLSPLSTALLTFAPFEDIQSVICSKPVSEPPDCSGLVQWCGCVCTRQRKR